jgi:hypothetical protein
METFHFMFFESFQVVGASPRAMPVSKGPRQRGQSASPDVVLFPNDLLPRLPTSERKTKKGSDLMFMN